jgi:hypothetical protein
MQSDSTKKLSKGLLDQHDEFSSSPGWASRIEPSSSTDENYIISSNQDSKRSTTKKHTSEGSNKPPFLRASFEENIDETLKASKGEISESEDDFGMYRTLNE